MTQQAPSSACLDRSQIFACVRHHTARIAGPLRRFLCEDESGQDIVEYALIATLVALSSISSMGGLAANISNAFQDIGNAVASATSSSSGDNSGSNGGSSSNTGGSDNGGGGGDGGHHHDHHGDHGDGD